MPRKPTRKPTRKSGKKSAKRGDYALPKYDPKHAQTAGVDIRGAFKMW